MRNLVAAFFLASLLGVASADEEHSEQFDCGHVGAGCHTASVPEPTSAILLGAGLIVAAWRRK